MEQTGDDQRPLERQPNERGSEARLIAKSLSPPDKLSALTHILLSEGSILNKRRVKGPSFHFGGCPVHQPQYSLFYRHDQPDPSAPPPTIAYVNYTHVSGSRWHKRQPPRNSTADDFVLRRISKEKHARVIPKEWTEDPYFVCILLSLAQLQENRLNPPRPTDYLSRLLAVSPFDQEFIHLYEAQIPSAFLRMLDKPTTATIEANLSVIKHRKIPFKPFETFQERILADLSINRTPSADSINDDTTNYNKKRAHEHEDGENYKRGRTS